MWLVFFGKKYLSDKFLASAVLYQNLPRQHRNSWGSEFFIKKMITEEPNKIKVARDHTPTLVKSVFRKRRQENMNVNGWGYSDSMFLYDKGQLTFTGDR